MTEPVDELGTAPIEYSDFEGFLDDPEDPFVSESALQKRIRSTWARVRKIAPCMADDDFELSGDDLEIVKDTMRSVILRSIDRGSGAIYSETSGDYSQTLATDKAVFRPAEIADLQAICGTVRKGKAYTAPTWNAEPAPTVHPFLTDTEHV